MASIEFGPERTRARLQQELPGWRVWYTLGFNGQEHSWSAMPVGAQAAVVIVYGHATLVEECREYEQTVEEHILDAPEKPERGKDTAPPPRLNVLSAHLDALMSLRVLLTARRAGIEVPS